MLSQRMQANLLYRWFVTDEEMDRPEENRLLEPWRSIFRTAEADIDMNEGLILGLSCADFMVRGVHAVWQWRRNAGADPDRRYLMPVLRCCVFRPCRSLQANLEPVTRLWRTGCQREC